MSVCLYCCLNVRHENLIFLRPVILSFVDCLAVLFFYISYKRHDFRKKVTEYKMCVLILSTTLSEIFLITSRIQGRSIINLYSYSHKVTVLSDFNKTRIFLTDFRKILEYENSWKSVQWKSSCVMRTDKRMDGQTDMTNLIAALRNFAKAHKWLNFHIHKRT
jgi:hypothetical protein